jgi:hypothetical protein
VIFVSRAVLFCLVVQLAGCGNSGNLSTVEGMVTVDGKPVPKGNVSFSPLDGGQAVSVDIVEGRYRAEAVARGPNRAHLNAFYLTGGTFVEFGIEYPEEKNLIPEKYLAGIDVEVTEASVQHDFELTSK